MNNIKFIILLFLIILIFYYINYKLKNGVIFEIFENKFNIKKKYNSIIPLNIYLCWHTKKLPQLMQKNYNNLVSQNPEFSVHLYDDNDCQTFIKKHFNKNVLDAFNKLIPGAYKADLWRYCILYINGGIYVDIKYKCINNFKFIALTEKEYLVRDRPKQSIYNGLMVLKPKNEILLKCINKIIYNVKNQVYGNSDLYPTGPKLLGSFYSLDYINNLKLYFAKYDFILYKNIKILSKYNEYRTEQSKYQNNKHYCQLWRERNIYSK